MTEEEKYRHWLTFQRFQQSREKFFAPKINIAIKDQYKSFTDAYKQGAYIDQAINQIDTAKLAETLRPVYFDAAIVYGAKVRAYLNRQKSRMPIGFNERMVELMKEYFNIDILNGAEEISDTTKEHIRRVLTEATEKGQGIDDIVKALSNTELSTKRARVIARTETVTAANRAGSFAAKDTGLLLNKEWLSTRDDRTRRHHITVNGQIVPMDEYFTVGASKMLVPGDRGGDDGRPKTPAKEVVNCRCTGLYIPIRNGAGRVMTA